MQSGRLKQLFVHYVTGSDCSYRELGPVGKLTRLLWISGLRYTVDRNSLRAVALTYYTLFAVVPMLALAFGIAKGFELQKKLQEILVDKLANQREILKWIYQFADTTLRQTQGGIIAGAGVIVLLWTVMWLVNNVEKSFNAIWNLPPRGNLFRRFSDYLSLILITPFLIIVLSSAGPVLRKLLDDGGRLGTAGTALFSLMSEIFPPLLICVTFSLIYFIAPNTKVKFRSAILGGIIGGLLFQLFQDGFIILQTSIYRYNKIYGSFAILPLFLVWLKLSWQIALFGAEVSFIHQHIGSGLFDRLGKEKLSLKLRREYQLLILGKIFRTFDRDGGAVEEEELLGTLPLPQVLTLSMLDELVEAGVIYKLEGLDDNRYLPGHPSEHYTICDALGRLGESGLVNPPTGNTPALERVIRSLKTIDRDASRSPGNLPLKEIDPS